MKKYLLVAMMMGLSCSLTDSALALDEADEEETVVVKLTPQQMETLQAMLDKKMNKKSKDKGIKKDKKNKKGKKSKRNKKSEEENTEE